jgi:hypothetical protein
VNDGRPVFLDECKGCHAPVYYARDGRWRKQTDQGRTCGITGTRLHVPTAHPEHPVVADGVDRG